MRGSRYATGVLCTLIGGNGLAEISTSNHGCFWLCTLVFVFGLSICLYEIITKEGEVNNADGKDL